MIVPVTTADQRIAKYVELATLKFVEEDFTFIEEVLQEIKQNWPNVEYRDDVNNPVQFPLTNTDARSLKVRIHMLEGATTITAYHQFESSGDERAIGLILPKEMKLNVKAISLMRGQLFHEYIHYIQVETVRNVDKLGDKLKLMSKIGNLSVNSLKAWTNNIPDTAKNKRIGLNRITLQPHTEWRKGNIRLAEIWLRYYKNTLETAAHAGQIVVELVYKYLTSGRVSGKVLTIKDACKQCLYETGAIITPGDVNSCIGFDLKNKIRDTETWHIIRNTALKGKRSTPIIDQPLYDRALIDILAKEVTRILRAIIESKSLEETKSRNEVIDQSAVTHFMS